MKFPQTVDLNVNGNCNLKCNFCYGPPRNSKDLKIEELAKVLYILKMGGTTSIAVTGGEPLLRDDIIDVLSLMKEMGFKTALHTNGILLENKYKIVKHLDWLCMPLDGSNPTLAKEVRNSSSSYEAVIRVLDGIKNKNLVRPSNIKIGTVVTRFNLSDLQNLAELIGEYDIDVWKLHEVRPRGIAKTFFNKIHISSYEIESEVEKIRNEQRAAKIFYSNMLQSIGAYLFVYPDGSVLTPHLSGYVNHGSIFNLPQSFNASAHLKKSSYEHNLKGAYLNTFFE